MALTFADTHNMIAYLTKSNACEGFNQIINFLNGSSIKYALTVNPKIYVSCIKQFWTSVSVKKVNDVTRLQALVDKKRVVIMEATIRDALRLANVEGIDCLPIEEIFTELARMGYEKPSTKLTFYKAFFSSQWKFLIHTILHERMIADMDADVDVTLKDIAKDVAVDAKIKESAYVQGRQADAARRRKGVVIRDLEETATPSTIIHTEAKSKDKWKGILVEDPKPLKKQAQIEQDEAYARELDAELNKNIDWDEVIDHVQGKEKEDNATKEQMEEEDSRALKRISETQEEKAAKKQKLDEEVAELKRHLQIVPNDDDDVYAEATPLARKVPVVDYEIYTENNKPYYKIIRADGSPQPKNFSDYFLLTTLTYMFEKPDVQAQVWKNQRTVHGLEKVKSWKLLESCGVHIITFTSTQMILLVERRYPLSSFGVDAAEDFNENMLSD
nr:hypothetical protein [Tanacetum cinerariifolium]